MKGTDIDHWGNKFILLLSIVLIPYFLLFRMNFSNLHSMDALGLTSPYSIVWLVSINTLLVLLFFQLRKREKSNQFIIVVPLFTVLIDSVLFVVLQYPSISTWDYYNHGSLVSSIISNHFVPTDFVYSSYPGSFLSFAFFSEITGVGIFPSMIILAAVLEISTFLVIYLLARLFLNSHAYYVALLWVITIFINPVLVSLDASPELINYFLSFAAIYLITRFLLKSGNFVSLSCLAIIVTLSITISHPISAIFLLSTYLVLFVFGRIERKRSQLNHNLESLLLASTIVVFLAWSLYMGGGVMSQSIHNIVSTIVSKTTATSVTGTLASSANTGIAEWYRRTISAFVIIAAALAVVRFSKVARVRLLTILSLGMFLPIILFAAMGSEVFLPRAEGFLWPLICILAIFALLRIRKTNWTSRKEFSVFSMIVLVGLLTVSFPASHSLDNQTYVHSWEQSAPYFVSTFARTNSISIDDPSVIYLRYYTHTVAGYVTGDFSVDPRTFNASAILKSNINVITYRLELDSFVFLQVPFASWKPLFAQLSSSPNTDYIYDSGFDHVYITS